MAKNKYCNRSRISEQKFREMLRYFCLDIEAKKISDLTGISEVTLCKYFAAIRKRLAEECEEEAKFHPGTVSRRGLSHHMYYTKISTSYFPVPKI